MVKELVIDRNVWLRGEGSQNSTLYRRSDGKMCCIGIYLNACGIQRDTLEGKMIAEDLPIVYYRKVPEWLYKHSDYVLTPGVPYGTNDRIASGEDEFTEEDREREITKAFAAHGVTVTFVN